MTTIAAEDPRIREVELGALSAAWRRPDSVVVDRPDWYQITTPSSPRYWLNGVLSSKLRGDEVDGRVAEIRAHYRALGCAFRWRVGPLTEPADMSERLLAHGFALEGMGYAMVGDVARLSIALPDGITFERVTLATVDDYVQAAVAGWATPPGADEEMRQDMRRSVGDPSHPTHYYVARVAGAPAGTAAMLPLKHSAYFLASSVAPAYRKRGVYRALVAGRIKVMRELGLPLATIQALSTTSAPICERLGFERIAEIRFYNLC